MTCCDTRGALASPVVMHRSIIVVTAAVAGLLLVAPPAWGDDGWEWPVRGRVVTMYSNDNARPYTRGMHRGIDIAADRGAAVVAARAGTVTYAGPLGAAGTIVAVRAGRYATSYLHLGGVSVSRGDRVASGHDSARSARPGGGRSRSRICTSACGWPAWTTAIWIRCRCCRRSAAMDTSGSSPFRPGRYRGPSPSR